MDNKDLIFNMLVEYKSDENFQNDVYFFEKVISLCNEKLKIAKDEMYCSKMQNIIDDIYEENLILFEKQTNEFLKLLKNIKPHSISSKSNDQQTSYLISFDVNNIRFCFTYTIIYNYRKGESETKYMMHVSNGEEYKCSSIETCDEFVRTLNLKFVTSELIGKLITKFYDVFELTEDCCDW
jgi:hypothetical protein